MRPGSLRFIMQILQRTPRRDNWGAAANDWTVFANIRASIVAISTTERAAFGGKQAAATHTVTCRYVAGVENSMRLYLPGQNRTFEITDIRTDPTMRRRMTIKAAEVVK